MTVCEHRCSVIIGPARCEVSGTWSYSRSLGKSQQREQMTGWGRGSSGRWATGGNMESKHVTARFQSGNLATVAEAYTTVSRTGGIK